MATYEAVAADVLAWARVEFPDATVFRAAAHLGDKTLEVMDEVDLDAPPDLQGDAGLVRRKVVSCALILVHLADLAGIDDLPAAMVAKLDEDKASRFEMDDERGYKRRVKGPS